MDSYLPYEGKVSIKNKNAEKLLVRIPLGVDHGTVRIDINGWSCEPLWVGNYLMIEKLAAKDIVTIHFPLETSTEKIQFNGKEFTLLFKGNTLIEISPRDSGPDEYRIYLRDYYKKDKAPMKKVSRYVSDALIPW